MTVLSNHSLPSPEYTGDSDSDSEIIKELEQKRRELDEEIARFQAQKDHEFKLFEADLKARKKQQRVQQQKHKHNAISYYEFTKNSPSATPPSHSSLKGYEKKSRSPSRVGTRQPEPIRLMKPHAGSKVTPPTICLDKMNISGENILQSHVSPLQTPPTPTAFSVFESDRQNKSTATASASKSTQSQARDSAPISPEQHMQEEAVALTGLFVPGFLPMLDARPDDSEREVLGTQTEPASPTGPCIADSMTIQSTSLPTVSSLNESLQMPQAKRAYTSPSSMNRSKLPPIIRNVNGRARTNGKRKHVTFQLADRAIVEPSSSYEEGPSPDVDGAETKAGTDSITSESSSESLTRPKIQRKKTPLDPFGRRKRQIKPVDTPTEEVGMSMGDLLLGADQNEEEPQVPEAKTSNGHDGYFSLPHSLPNTSSLSPEKSDSFGSVDDNAYMHKRKGLLCEQKQQRRNSRSPRTSPTVSRQTSFEKQTSTADKLATKAYQSPRFPPTYSPITRPMQSQYPGTLEDDLLLGHGNVGFFELDEELNGADAGVPNPELPEDKEEELEVSRSRRSNKRDTSSEIQTGTSVPIDIIRPGSISVSNSWVGTFGH